MVAEGCGATSNRRPDPAAPSADAVRGAAAPQVATAPAAICFCRLDTCFYESTRHELVHLFPRLVSGGVLHIDDYGIWKGSRLATDEYVAQNHLKLLLARIDRHGARMAVKP